MTGRPTGTYSQARRALELYDRLKARGVVNPAEAAVEFGCNLRTIQRDMRLLREVLPTLDHVEREYGWVYHLPLGDRRFTVDASQVLAIVAGAKATRLVAGRRFSNEVGPLLEQLRRSLPPGKQLAIERVERKVCITRTGEKPYFAREHLQEALSVMIDGLMIEKPVSLDYLSNQRALAGAEPTHMTIHPLAIAFHRGGVYFVVQTADQRRLSLALDRMSNLRLLSEEEQFRYPADFDADVFFDEAWGIDLREPLHEVALRLTPFITAFVRERSWGRNESYELHPDGSATMRFSAKGEVELLEWIGGMGAEVEVLEPPELRAKMRERLRTALAAYDREE